MLTAAPTYYSQKKLMKVYGSKLMEKIMQFQKQVWKSRNDKKIIHGIPCKCYHSLAHYYLSAERTNMKRNNLH